MVPAVRTVIPTRQSPSKILLGHRIPARRRLAGGARRALLGVLAWALLACGGREGRDGGADASKPSAHPPRTEHRDVPEPRRPDAYVFVRTIYAVGGAARDLPVRRPLEDAPALVLEELQGTLDRLAAAGTRGGEGGPAGGVQDHPVRGEAAFGRTYQLAAAADPGAFLEILDRPDGSGSYPRAETLARMAPVRGEVDGGGLVLAHAPALLDHLRDASLAKLREAMEPPGHPLDWHVVALCGFVVTPRGAPGARVGAEDRAMIVDYVLQTEDPVPAAKALLGAVGGFDPGELAPLSRAPALAARLVPVARSALDGDREALREVFALSLEYQGREDVFCEAARTLFAGSTSGGKSIDCGDPAAARTYLQTIHARLAEAVFEPGAGWSFGKDPAR